MSNWEEIYRKLDSISEYAVIWAELKSSGLFKGMAFYNLPTFEYYYKNCVLDKGGKYDFTVRRYSQTASCVLEVPPCCHGKMIGRHFVTGLQPKKVTLRHKWGYWMGAEFGRIEEVI